MSQKLRRRFKIDRFNRINYRSVSGTITKESLIEVIIKSFSFRMGGLYKLKWSPGNKCFFACKRFEFIIDLFGVPFHFHTS